MPASFRLLLPGLGVVLLQWLVLSRLQVFGIYPDGVLLFVVYAALRYGRVPGMVAGCSMGFLADLLVTPEAMGVHMLVKTLVGFAVGSFRPDQADLARLPFQQAVLGAFAIALVHNGLVVFLLALTQQTRVPFLILGLWLGGALYTALLAVVASTFRGTTSR